jgi:hypothetical protein
MSTCYSSRAKGRSENQKEQSSICGITTLKYTLQRIDLLLLVLFHTFTMNTVTQASVDSNSINFEYIDFIRHPQYLLKAHLFQLIHCHSKDLYRSQSQKQ